jgi:hypothetical protein
MTSTSTNNTRYFKVTLTLDFTYHYSDAEDLEEFQENYSYGRSKEEFEEQKKELEATNALYGTQKQIQAFIKGFDPLEVVEYIPDHEVVSAEWHKDEFKISFIMKAENCKETLEEIERSIQMNSLEDGEYESCGTSAWTVKTLGETMEYGLTDYRENLILVEELDPQKLIAAA